MASLRISHPERYTAVAILLHWLIALGVLALIVIGLAMTQWPGAIGPAETFTLYQLHKSIGITVLLLGAVRLLWRLTHKPPALPGSMPVAEKAAARGVHWLLYAWGIGLPLTGWALVSSSPLNLPLVLYGVLPWPDLPVLPHLADKALVSHRFALLHIYGAWILIGILVLHTGAVVRHQLIKGDNILARMVPGLGAARR
jgi:cytochrome b561